MTKYLPHFSVTASTANRNRITINKTNSRLCLKNSCLALLPLISTRIQLIVTQNSLKIMWRNVAESNL
jgi:hypothetical protein